MSALSVLLVDDNVANRELARDLLELEGHHVTVAHDGVSFRACVVAAPRFDVVLMDILLPDADGAELLHELRAMPAYATVPVVAVTAQALPSELERLERAGFDTVLTKPIDTRTFVARVIERARR